jgi:hypothetical protein
LAQWRVAPLYQYIRAVQQIGVDVGGDYLFIPIKYDSPTTQRVGAKTDDNAVNSRLSPGLITPLKCSMGKVNFDVVA